MLVEGMIFLGFAGFGVGMPVGGLYIMTNRLVTIVGQDTVTRVRLAFGRRWDKVIEKSADSHAGAEG